MKQTTRKDRQGKGSARSDPFYEGSWQRRFSAKIAFFGAKYYLCSMKQSVFILVFTIFAAFAAPAQVNVGMTDTASYYPLLRGRRVAVLANQTSVAELPARRGPMPPGGCIWSTCSTAKGLPSRRSSRPSTDSAARPMPGSGSQVRSTPGRAFPSARSTTATRNGLRTRRCARSTCWSSTCRTWVCASIPIISRCCG